MPYFFGRCSVYASVVSSLVVSLSTYTAEFFPDRTEVQCLHRWQKVLNPELIKGPWTQEVCLCTPDFAWKKRLLHIYRYIYIFMIFFLQEDDKIIDLVKKYGPTKWSVIARSLPGRIGKQCRERYSFDCSIFIWFAEMHSPLCARQTGGSLLIQKHTGYIKSWLVNMKLILNSYITS